MVLPLSGGMPGFLRKISRDRRHGKKLYQSSQHHRKDVTIFPSSELLAAVEEPRDPETGRILHSSEYEDYGYTTDGIPRVDHPMRLSKTLKLEETAKWFE